MNYARRFLPLLAGLVFVGCATPNANPPVPRANTGYLDLYTDSSLDLSWDVKCVDGGKSQTLYSEMEPMPGTVLRLAVPPGNHRFEVWVVNRVTDGPETIDTRIEDGKVTPVHITLKPSGTSIVDRKAYGVRPSAKGYGRGTKIVRDESQAFVVSAAANTPQAYQPKERMPYFR